jgi:UDP-N-acetylglucosamine 2-epimerase
MKFAAVVGARPQLIKCACLSHELRKAATEILIHTGQHYDDNMSATFFRELDIPEPDYHLGVGSGTHGAQTGEMLKRIEEVFVKENPDCVLVYGDTNSTLAGALAAAKLRLPLAHIEAGLRSFNRSMPEEINRVVTDHVSNFLFSPTETAVRNLKEEGVEEGVYHVGDVMFDAALQYGDRAESYSRILERLKLCPKNYALATIHRAENTDDPERFCSIFYTLEEIAKSELPVDNPLHPRSRKQFNSLDLSFSHLQIIEPVSYLDMLLLEKQARIILTDSGGVQKEAYFFQVPCLTLREETEWVETVEAGWNTLVGMQKKKMLQGIREGRAGSNADWPYGNGDSAQKITRILMQQFSMVR